MPEENENGNGKEEIQSKGLVRVLEILANKVSRKAAIIGMAMILIYLLAVTPTVTTINILTIVGIIAGLSVFAVVLQWTIDKKNAKYRQERELKKKE